MNHAYVNIIKNALDAIDYTDEKDNNRLRAAVQDLSSNYFQENKLFQISADDRFLQICSSALSCNSQQYEIQKKQAVQHLQNEYYILENLANEFTEIVMQGFCVYGKGEAGL